MKKTTLSINYKLFIILRSYEHYVGLKKMREYKLNKNYSLKRAMNENTIIKNLYDISSVKFKKYHVRYARQYLDQLNIYREEVSVFQNVLSNLQESYNKIPKTWFKNFDEYMDFLVIRYMMLNYEELYLKNRVNIEIKHNLDYYKKTKEK